MKKKPRGLRRKCASLLRRLAEQTEVFPEPHQGSASWHLHLPVDETLIDSVNSSRRFRHFCVQALLNRARYLSGIAPTLQTPTQVVVAISSPRLWDSQIIVFFDHDYFNGFFQRNTPAQSWTEIEAGRSFSREWQIQIAEGFLEKGYREKIVEPDFQQSGEIWFMGQLDSQEHHEKQTKLETGDL